MVIASLEAPSLSSASVAPPINRLTMKSFQRLATIATRIPSALEASLDRLSQSASPLHLAEAPPLFFLRRESTSTQAPYFSIINFNSSIVFDFQACQASLLC